MQQAYIEHQLHFSMAPDLSSQSRFVGGSAGTQDKTGRDGEPLQAEAGWIYPVWKSHVVGNGWQVGAECGGDEPYWMTFCVSPGSWDLISTWRKHSLHCLPQNSDSWTCKRRNLQSVGLLEKSDGITSP